MSERGIIFSAPMVRALLAGRKTQTRRIIKKPAALDALAVFGPTMLLQPGCADLLPFAPGDRLWIRETWHPDGDPGPSYRADYHPASGDGWGWKPSIHMPRWASRLTLLVTEVRVQRLQEISEEDAIAEGMIRSEPTDEDEEWNRDYCARNDYPYQPLKGVWLAPGTRQGWGMTQAERDRPQWGPTAAFAFRYTWKSIHGPGSWDANPFVAAVSFRREGER